MAKTTYYICMVDKNLKFVGFLSSTIKEDLIARSKKYRQYKPYKKMLALYDDVYQLPYFNIKRGVSRKIVKRSSHKT